MLKNFRNLSNSFFKLAAAVVIAAAVLSFAFGAVIVTPAHAELDENAFSLSQVAVTNSDFTIGVSQARLTSPDSWTEEIYGDSSKGSSISGVIDLSTYYDTTLAEDDLKLTMYNENKTSIPRRSPDATDDDSKVLMINTNNSDVAFGYKSSTFNIQPNSYYSFSVWVLTGEFTSGGASIRLKGLNNDLVFSDIDTHDYIRRTTGLTNFDNINKSKDLDFGWVKYTFLVETSSIMESTVSLNLGIGDYYEYEDSATGKKSADKKPANGYALFDHVEVFQHSPQDFDKLVYNAKYDAGHTIEYFPNPDIASRTYSMSAKKDLMYYSECAAQILSIDDDGNILSEDDPNFTACDVGSFDNGTKGWKPIDSTTSKTLRTGIFNTYNDEAGIKEEKGVIPFSPNGGDDNIAVISTYNSKDNRFEKATVGYRSPDFTIERFKYYRLSVWVKALDEQVAKVALGGYNYEGPDISLSPENPKYGEGKLFVSTSLTHGDESNVSRNYWKEEAFYIKGSSFENYKLHIELWLGETDNPLAGAAMFDNIRIEAISPTQYTQHSSRGTAVELDRKIEDPPLMTNGFFNEIDDYDYYGYPFKPHGWSLVSAGVNHTDGMSDNIVDKNFDDYSIHGVISSDTTVVERAVKSVTETEKDKFSIDTKYGADKSNLLMIKNLKPLAVGYRSNTFSLAGGSYFRIEVTLSTQIDEGYGASVVFKDKDQVLAAIENIDTEGKFEKYTIYIRTGGKSFGEPVVEIWNGLYDNIDNRSKLSQGIVLVDKVEVINFNDPEDQNAEQPEVPAENVWNAAYINIAANTETCKAAMLDQCQENFITFDMSDPEFIKKPYTFHLEQGSNVTYGIFDGTAVTSTPSDDAERESGAFSRDQVILNGTYDHTGASGRYSFVIKNNAPTYSRVKHNLALTMDDDKYYRITIKAKIYGVYGNSTNATDGVVTSSAYKGAYFGIVGGDRDEEILFDDIKSSQAVVSINGDVDPLDTSFKEYTLIVHTSGLVKEKEENINHQTYYLVLGIGGQKIDEYATGTMIIGGLYFEETTNSDFEEAQAAQDKNGSSRSAFRKAVDLGDHSEEDAEDELKDNKEFNISDAWYAYSSILLVVAILIGLTAYLVRYFAKKRKLAGVAEVGTVASYDRTRTLNKQHNLRNKGTAGAINIEQSSDPYDVFDEDLEREIEQAKLQAAIEKQQAEEFKDFITEDPIITAETELPEIEEATEEAPVEVEAEAEAPAETESPAVAEAETAEEEQEDVDYEAVVDFSARAREKKDKAAEIEAKRKQEEEEKEAARIAAEEAESDRIKQIKKDKREYDKWDDFDD